MIFQNGVAPFYLDFIEIPLITCSNITRVHFSLLPKLFYSIRATTKGSNLDIYSRR